MSGTRTLFSSVAFGVQVLNHGSSQTEELVHLCGGKPIRRELLNLVCCSAHNLAELSTLGRKRDVTPPAVIRAGLALNKPIALHPPQGDSHCGLLDPYQTRKLCLARFRQLHEPSDDRINAGQDAVPCRSF